MHAAWPAFSQITWCKDLPKSVDMLLGFIYLHEVLCDNHVCNSEFPKKAVDTHFAPKAFTLQVVIDFNLAFWGTSIVIKENQGAGLAKQTKKGFQV